jgi:RNA polymerase sigma-70 factor (ECF subfamily)
LENFEKIFAEYYPQLYRMARKMVLGHDEAADIVQEVFISLHNHLNGQTRILNHRAWLFRATINKSIDNYKRVSRFRPLEVLSDKKDNIKSLEKEEEVQIVQKALSKLPNKERALAVMYSEGCSYKEISEATSIPISSIGTTLSRVLKKLEKELISQRYEMY